MKEYFSKSVKKELMSVPAKDCCKISECYGMLICASFFSSRAISLYTESQSIAQKYTNAVQKICGVRCGLYSPQTEGGGLYLCSVEKTADRKLVLDKFSHKSNDISIRINFANFENECCYAAFLRGVFLVCGSISDPQKNYRLEFSIQHKNLASDIIRVLFEVDITANITSRGNGYAIYINESEQIEDLLTMMGAQNSSLQLMNVKIYKDIRNKANRLTNCETANISKTADAAARQIHAINRIKDKGCFTSLSDSLRAAAEIRIENAEMSLSEMCAMCGISKSGLSHRLNKLIEISKNL